MFTTFQLALTGGLLTTVAVCIAICIEIHIKRHVPKSIDTANDIPDNYKFPICGTFFLGTIGIVMLVAAYFK